MAKNKKKQSPLRSLLDPKKVLIPVLIGVGFIGYQLYKELDGDSFKQLHFTWASVGWLLVAALTAVLRDVGYMIRLRILSEGKITWRNIFDDIMLWEFSSAVTPSVVGGSGVAIFILNKEGLNVGKSTAVVMTTAFLDELFYVVMVPLLIMIVGTDVLFPEALRHIDFLGAERSIESVFWLGYGFIMVLIGIIAFGLFIKPKALKSVLASVFSISFLKRWKKGAVQTGTDIVITSNDLKSKSFKFWLDSFLVTALSWTSRYLTANFILMAFTNLSLHQHLVILMRQLVMWVIMLISPTPGGEGVAQLAFDNFLHEFTPEGHGVSLALSVLWRMFTYYPYLILGLIILPRWIQRVYLKRKLIKFKN